MRIWEVTEAIIHIRCLFVPGELALNLGRAPGSEREGLCSDHGSSTHRVCVLKEVT